MEDMQSPGRVRSGRRRRYSMSRRPRRGCWAHIDDNDDAQVMSHHRGQSAASAVSVSVGSYIEGWDEEGEWDGGLV